MTQKICWHGWYEKIGRFNSSDKDLGKNVLLLDSGDIFQGTPYFNKYKGEVELKIMSNLGMMLQPWEITILIMELKDSKRCYRIPFSILMLKL